MESTDNGSEKTKEEKVVVLPVEKKGPATVTKLIRNREDLIDAPPLFPTENLNQAENTLYNALNDLHESFFLLKEKADDVLSAEYDYKEALKERVINTDEELAEVEAITLIAQTDFITAWGKAQVSLSTIGKLMAINGNRAFTEALS